MVRRANQVAPGRATVLAHREASAADDVLNAVGGDLGGDLAATREPETGNDLPRAGGRDGENRFSHL